MQLRSKKMISQISLKKIGKSRRRFYVNSLIDDAQNFCMKALDDRRQTVILNGGPQTMTSMIEKAKIIELLTDAMIDIAAFCKRDAIISVGYTTNCFTFNGWNPVNLFGEAPAMGEMLQHHATAMNARAILSWHDGVGPFLVLKLPTTTLVHPARNGEHHNPDAHLGIILQS